MLVMMIGFVSEAKAQLAGAEVIQPIVTYATNLGCANGHYGSAQEAFSAIQQGCSSYCMEWNNFTQANPTAYQVFGTAYQTCNPPNSRSDPVTQPFGLIAGSGSCASFPGYLPGNFGPEFPFGGCYIFLVKYDQAQKPCDTCIGNPVILGSGNKQQIEIDYLGHGIAPLTFRRIYNSASQFARRWRTSFDNSVDYQTATGKVTATLNRPEGSYAFTIMNGNWVSDADVNFKLFGSNGGFQVVTPTGDHESYDNWNKLSTVTSGVSTPKFTLSYGNTSAHLLSAIGDPFGHSIGLTYDSQGRLSTMTDPSGGVYQYAYDGSGNLVSVLFPDGATRQYFYNEAAFNAGINQPAALTGIIDENNARYANFGYDALGNAVLTEHSGGANRYAITYSVPPAVLSTATVDVANHVKYVVKSLQAPSGVAVTDALGAVRHYGFIELNGTVKGSTTDQPCLGGCASTQTSRMYDANGNVTLETDFNGNQTTYAYDLTRNLPTSRTEAYGPLRARNATTQWNATYRLPTLITEPGKTSAFTHDANGNVLTKIVTDTATSTARTWTYTYNSYGQMLTADGPRTDVSDVTTYTYYSCTTGYECGQIHTVTDALNHVTTYNTYNAHGQPLTMTDPNGVVTTLTYDLRQRLTLRAVGSETTTFEYWPTGLLKKVTLPDTSYLLYAYDAAHRLTDVTDLLGDNVHYSLDAMGNRTKEEAFDPSSTLSRTRRRVFDSLNRLSKEIGAANSTAVTTTFGYDSNGNQTSISA